MKNISATTRQLVLAAVMLALCLVLPFFTAQIKEIGDSLLPMHFPVLLCGLLCGWKYGLLVGLIAPILRSILFGMPPLYPNAIWMAAELATYGFVIGILYSLFSKKNITSVYLSLIPALIGGRVTLAIAKIILLSINQKTFVFYNFLMSSVVDALPGILLQLIFVPAIVLMVQRFQRQNNERGIL